MKCILSRFCKKESNVASEDIKELTVAIKDLRSSIENKKHNPPEIHEEKNNKGFTDASSTVWNILEKWKTILTFSTPFSIFVGGIIIYNYLNNINNVALFSEIVSSPFLFISIVIFSFILISFTFIFPFYGPYFVADEIKRLRGSKKAFSWNIAGTMLLTLLIFMIIFFVNKENNLTYTTALMIIFIPPIVIFPIVVCKLKVWGSKIVDFFLINLFQHVLFLLILLFSSFFATEGWFENKGLSLFFMFIVSVFYIANTLYLGKISFEENKLGDSGFKFLAPFFFAAIMSFLLASIPGSNVSMNLLHRLGYIQKPNDAQWYAFDNRLIDWYKLQTNTSEEIYSFRNWKEKFQPTEAKEKAHNLSKNPNTLYGYMAWNVGSTKIFCPKSVELPKETEAKDKRHAIKFSTQCLTIKGDYLQPLPTGL